MDLDQLRQARLSKYAGEAGGSAVSSVSTQQTAPIPPISEVVEAPNVQDGGGPGPMPTSDTGVLNMLTEVRDLLLQLPGSIAAALAATPVVGAPVVGAPAVASAQAAAVGGPAEAPENMNPAFLDDIFLENNGNEDVGDTCGVCHMAVAGKIYAFDQCGHYPFCVTCANEVKKTQGASKCPYCKSLGKSIDLQLED